MSNNPYSVLLVDDDQDVFGLLFVLDEHIINQVKGH